MSPNPLEYFPKNMKYKTLDDIESHLTDEEKELINICNEIYNVNSENYETVCQDIDKYGKNLTYLAHVTEHALYVRSKTKRVLANLLGYFYTKYEIHVAKCEGAEIMSALHVLKHDILAMFRENLPIEEYTEVYPQGSIKQIIRDDDVEEFKKLYESPDFSVKKNIVAKRYENINNVYFKVSKYPTVREHCPLMHLMAYFGAVNCFKFALQHKDLIDTVGISDFAVAGGNREIIQLLVDRKVSFDNCFRTAIQFVRNDICDWLLKNYKCEMDSEKIMSSYNDTMYYFYDLNGLIDYNRRYESPFETSLDRGNVVLVKHIAMRIPNKNALQGMIGKEGFIKAIASKDLELVKFLLEKCSIDVNKQTGDYQDNMVPVHSAIKAGDFNMVKFLVEEVHADPSIECKDAFVKGRNSLHVAASRRNLEIVKYLVEKCHLDVNKPLISTYETMSGRPYQTIKTPLDIAANSNNLEIVRYLVKEAHAKIENNSFSSIKGDYGKIYKESPVALAIKEHQFDVVKFFVEECNINLKDKLPVLLETNSGGVSFSTKTAATIAKNVGYDKATELIKNAGKKKK